MKKIIIILLLPLSLLGQNSNEDFWFGQLGHNSYVDLLTGLLAAYELDETSGTTVFDAYGSNDGTYINAPTLEQPTVANLTHSVYFNGTDEYADLGDVTFFDGLTKLSISFWINLSSVGPGKDGDRHISKWDVGQRTLMIRQTTGSSGGADCIRFYVSSNGSNITYWTTNGGLYTGSMIHVVTTWDGTAEVAKCYINGSEVTFTKGDAVVINSLYNGTEHLSFMARYHGGSPDVHAQGYLDQPRFYDIVLTQEQIDRLYNHWNGTKVDQ